MSNKEFADRLKTACSQNENIPPYGYGLQTWVKEAMKVSHEAVRKWFTGESRPRPKKMRELAQVLGVDEAWLSLGVKPDADPHERRTRSTHAGGAINIVIGLVQLNGGHCGVPDAHDPRASFVDFNIVTQGKTIACNVSMAKDLDTKTFKLITPSEFKQCTVLGLIYKPPTELCLLKMPSELIEKHSLGHGGYQEIIITRRGNEYFSGPDAWPLINSISELWS